MNVSVAMCTYNGSQYLGDQLKGIGEQTKAPCEAIICDDGSTDATPDIVREFAKGAPFPVRFIRNEVRLGSTKNFEKAIGLCNGEAIALCDQDDLWERDKLCRMAQMLGRESDVGGVFSDASLIDEKSNSLADSLWERREFTHKMQATLNGTCPALVLLERNMVTGATLLFRSHFVKQVTPIPAEWVHDAWIAFLIAAQSRLRAVPERLMSYRLHPMQQIGMKAVRWQDALDVERDTAIAAHDLLLNRWCLMTAKLATLPVDPTITRLVQNKVKFLQTRSGLRQQGLGGRFVGATVALPGYFRFSRGLLSYCRDITRAGYRQRATADRGDSPPSSSGNGRVQV